MLPALVWKDTTALETHLNLTLLVSAYCTSCTFSVKHCQIKICHFSSDFCQCRYSTYIVWLGWGGFDQLFNIFFVSITIALHVQHSLEPGASIHELITAWFILTDGVTGDVCPVGFYCPQQSDQPTPCPDATYMNHTGASVCYDCPDGYKCTRGDIAEPCPQGYYCPQSTGLAIPPCPVG